MINRALRWAEIMYFAFFLDEHMMSTVTVEVWTPESELENAFFSCMLQSVQLSTERRSIET